MMVKRAKNIKFDEFDSRRKKIFWFSKFEEGKAVFEYWDKDQYVFSNFALNCYYHHCCCLNEQSFKFETFLSTSVESLLVLFAVAFTSYCQVIIVKSMFNSYQVDLSLGNSFFIHISSVSFSLIMFSTVRYIMFMLAPRFSKILHFDEYNITKFLEHFEKQCDEYKIIEKK